MASDPVPREPPPIRPARAADLPAILRIERSSFTVPWTDRAFRAVMARPEAALLVAGTEGRVAGYAAFWIEGRDAELGDLAVARHRRRSGLGRRLVEAAAGEAGDRGAERIFLQVRESNEEALALYRSAGFRRIGRKRGYYRTPREDALVLIREVVAGAR